MKYTLDGARNIPVGAKGFPAVEREDPKRGEPSVGNSRSDFEGCCP